MKRIISCILIISMLFTCQSIVLASDASEHIEYEYFEDGSYVKSIISENKDSEISIFSTTTKTGSKTSTFYNADDEAMWYVKVTGTFTYSSGNYICTSSSVSAESYNSAWKITEKSSAKSGNSAIATATAKRYVTFVPVQTINEKVLLTCSSTGLFS